MAKTNKNKKLIFFHIFFSIYASDLYNFPIQITFSINYLYIQILLNLFCTNHNVYCTFFYNLLNLSTTLLNDNSNTNIELVHNPGQHFYQYFCLNVLLQCLNCLRVFLVTSVCQISSNN